MRSRLYTLAITASATVLLVFAAGSSGIGETDSLGVTDPNLRLFPDSSMLSFQHLLETPAGKLGFLQVRDGKFAWKSGRRARFWGINVSNRSVWVDKATIDRVVDVFARAGCNMVRFEALDSVGGLLDVPGTMSSRAIDAQKLATLDYWIARLRQRGIYTYLNLLDFRQFKEGDEVPAFDKIGRAAKPYAFFNSRLIELQKEFARQLLTHRNPHTGLRYVDDPGLALIEICNEHGLFMKSEMLDDLAEPYGTEFRRLWNQWLSRKYGSRGALKQSWGKFRGEYALTDSEDPASDSVRLPSFSRLPASLQSDPAVVDNRRSPGRLRDGVEFLSDIQRRYFREMRGFVRSLGAKVPITGVVSNDIIPDVASAAAELDFTSENYYGDHPSFAGADWQGKFFYNNTNPLRMSSVYQIAPWISALRWENKPVVIRELATVWPNRYRAIGLPEAAAYALMQDFDAVLLFGYNITTRPDSLNDFDHQADPAVWGLFAHAAQTFLRGDVAASRYGAALTYSPESLYRWPNRIGDIHRLSWFVRLNSSRSAAATPKTTLRVRRADSVGAALNRFKAAGAKVHSGMLTPPVLISSTGQIERRVTDGLLRVVSPRAVSIAGEIPVNRWIKLGPFTVSSATPVGAFMAVSLDGKPLSSSRRFVVKMVSVAENTGQELVPAEPGAPARFHLRQWGKAPVKTNGRPSSISTIVKRGTEELIRIAMTDGTWEIAVNGSRSTLSCDTPGIRGALLGRAFVTVPRSFLTVDSRASAPPDLP